jgi:hypothetical protein
MSTKVIISKDGSCPYCKKKDENWQCPVCKTKISLFKKTLCTSANRFRHTKQIEVKLNFLFDFLFDFLFGLINLFLKLFPKKCRLPGNHFHISCRNDVSFCSNCRINIDMPGCGGEHIMVVDDQIETVDINEVLNKIKKEKETQEVIDS